MFSLFFFFNDTATTEIYTLSLQTLFRSRERELLLRLLRVLHEALGATGALLERRRFERHRSEEHTSELQSLAYLVCRLLLEKKNRHSTRILSHTPSTHHKTNSIHILARH